MFPDLVKIGHHDGKRFCGPPFPLTQPPHRRHVRGVAGQLEAAQTFDGQDGARIDQGGRLLYDVRILRGIGRYGQGRFGRCGGHGQPDPGSADRAGVGLGVKAPVERVVVLGLAGRAHPERGHGGQGAVIRNIGDDGKPGSAVGTVDERIAVTPVGRIEELPPAVVADGDVRGDEDVPLLGPAFPDLEPVRPGGRDRPGLHILDPRDRRRLRDETGREPLHRVRSPFHFDDDARGGVADPSAEAQSDGEAVDEGPEAHALDDSLDFDVERRNGGIHITPSDLRNRGKTARTLFKTQAPGIPGERRSSCPNKHFGNSGEDPGALPSLPVTLPGGPSSVSRSSPPRRRPLPPSDRTARKEALWG